MIDNKMEELFDNKELVEKFGENAKKQAEDNYSKEYYYKEISKIYNHVLRGEGNV